MVSVSKIHQVMKLVKIAFDYTVETGLSDSSNCPTLSPISIVFSIIESSDLHVNTMILRENIKSQDQNTWKNDT